MPNNDDWDESSESLTVGPKVTIEELINAITRMQPGQYVKIDLIMFERFFGGSLDDGKAQDAAEAFADEHGVRIELRRSQKTVMFVRDNEGRARV